MEYPFKDLLPLDEVLAREGYYKDWTHLDPEVFYSLTQISEYIKTKGYGIDVRLLIAQLAEHFGLKTTQVVDLANLLTAKHATLKTQFEQSVAQMEAEKDAVIANATVDSEVILARGGMPTLQARLDDTATQLAGKNQVVNLSSFKTINNTWSQALQECINFANANLCKTIKLPSNTDIVIDTPITNGGDEKAWDLIIEGDGKGIDGRGSCLVFNGTSSEYLFTNDLSLPVAGAWRGITFKNLSIRAGNNFCNGIKLLFNQQSLFENVDFVGFNNAVTITGNSHYPIFRNCKFTNCKRGINIPDVADIEFVVGHANNGKIDNCLFTMCEEPIHQLDGGAGWVVENTDFEGNNGTISLGQKTKIIGGRIERNLNGQQWLKLGNDSFALIDFHMAGGNIASEAMVLGDRCTVYVTGMAKRLISETSGDYNDIYVESVKPFDQASSTPFIRKLKNTNRIVRKGNYTPINLVNPKINEWTVNPSANVTESTLDDNSIAFQLEKNTSGDIILVNSTINGSFKNGDFIFVTLNYKMMAGGGFTIVINGAARGIIDNFTTTTESATTIIAIPIDSDVTNPTIAIANPYGGSGSVIRLGNLKVTKQII